MKKVMKIRADQKTWLAGRILDPVSGGTTFEGPSPYCLFCRGDGRAVWTVDLEKDESFELRLAYFTNCENNVITLSSQEQMLRLTLDPVPGFAKNLVPMRDKVMMQNPEDCESVDVDGILKLEKGRREIIVDIQTKGEFRIFYLELIPLSCKEAIVKKEAEAIAGRPSIQGIVKDGYGVMVHWTSRAKPRYGKEKPYEQAVNDFDVEAFADTMQEIGASYVMFTTNHIDIVFPAPLYSWEKYHSRKTTQRDLIADLIAALAKRNIKFFMYIHLPNAANYPPMTGTGFNFSNEDMQAMEHLDEYMRRLCEIFTEIGNRYGTGLKGYWLDGWQMAIAKYGIDPTEKVYKATKIGNPDRLTTFAFGVRYPTCTPWQDYACGETRVIGALPVNGVYARGQNKGYPYHSIIVMDDDWWHDDYDTRIADPQYNAEQLSTYINGCRENGGMVTMNIGVYQDGTISEETKKVMAEVKKAVYK